MGDEDENKSIKSRFAFINSRYISDGKFEI
jgi:hypothetical protein